jgi:hypothetical protein
MSKIIFILLVSLVIAKVAAQVNRAPAPVKPPYIKQKSATLGRPVNGIQQSKGAAQVYKAPVKPYIKSNSATLGRGAPVYGQQQSKGAAPGRALVNGQQQSTSAAQGRALVNGQQRSTGAAQGRALVNGQQRSTGAAQGRALVNGQQQSNGRAPVNRTKRETSIFDIPPLILPPPLPKVATPVNGVYRSKITYIGKPYPGKLPRTR